VADDAGSEGRYALIVATSEYREAKLGRLRAPAADADRLAAVLGHPEIGGFAVEVLKDAEERDLRRRLAGFFANRRTTDVLLLHVSCHGVKDERGDLYLAATDTELGLLGATGVSAAWLNDQITGSRSRRKVLLLDCCFSGSFPIGSRHRAGTSVDVPSQFEGHGRGLAVITASNAMEYAFEGDQVSGEEEPSYFTDAVLEGLETGRADRDQDQWISVQELYDFVYDRVRDRTTSQNPTIKSELQGPLYLARSRYHEPVEATPPEPVAEPEAEPEPEPALQPEPPKPPPPVFTPQPRPPRRRPWPIVAAGAAVIAVAAAVLIASSGGGGGGGTPPSNTPDPTTTPERPTAQISAKARLTSYLPPSVAKGCDYTDAEGARPRALAIARCIPEGYSVEYWLHTSRSTMDKHYDQDLDVAQNGSPNGADPYQHVSGACTRPTGSSTYDTVTWANGRVLCQWDANPQPSQSVTWTDTRSSIWGDLLGETDAYQAFKDRFHTRESSLERSAAALND
jgi:hypothetical protein